MAFFRIHSQGKIQNLASRVSLEDVDLEFMFYGTKSLIMNKNFSSKFKKKNASSIRENLTYVIASVKNLELTE